MTPQAALERGLAQMDLDLPPVGRNKLVAYLELLAKWNRTYNLTAIRDPLTMVTHHVLDALAVLAPLHAACALTSLADVGSGSGTPGIPLAIARPDCEVVLTDSNEKKAAFLRQAAIELDLENTHVQLGRVEAWRPARSFDCAISRAFSALAPFVDACLHLVRPGGVLAAMKGRIHDAELAEATRGALRPNLVRIRVPFVDAERALVLFRVPIAT